MDSNAKPATTQRQFPPQAYRPLVAHIRHAHASAGGTFIQQRSFVTDPQGARLVAEGRLIVWRGTETTPRALAALKQHADVFAQARQAGQPTAPEPLPVMAERQAA